MAPGSLLSAVPCARGSKDEEGESMTVCAYAAIFRKESTSYSQDTMRFQLGTVGTPPQNQ